MIFKTQPFSLFKPLLFLRIHAKNVCRDCKISEEDVAFGRKIDMVNRWGKRSVSKTESFLSTFGFLYTFLGLYGVTNILLFLHAAVNEAERHQDFQKYVTAISRACGAIINFNMAVVLLVASRSVIGFLRETPLTLVLPIDKAMPDFHRTNGLILVGAAVLHTITHCVTYFIKQPWSSGYNGFTSLFITGTILLILILAIRISARASVYKSNYEAFHRIHIGGAVISYITLVIHGLHQGQPSTWKWIIAPVIIYLLDVGFRSFREKRSYLLVSKHSAVFQGPDILKIRLPRVFHFTAGQYAELKVPELSQFQWHPFTIASAPHEPEMVFYIKAVGDWTISLYQLFNERLREGGQDIEVHIRGPYGAPAQHVGQFDRVIVVGGGVGATPFCSVVKDAYNWMTNWTPQLEARQARSIWEENAGRQQELRQSQDQIGLLPTTNSLHATDTRRSGMASDPDHSHIFTTNVFSEPLDLTDGDIRVEPGEDVIEKDISGLNLPRALSGDSINPVKRLDVISRNSASIPPQQNEPAPRSPPKIGSSSSDSTGDSLAVNTKPDAASIMNRSPFQDRSLVLPLPVVSTFTKPIHQLRDGKRPTTAHLQRDVDRDDDGGMGSYHANSIGSTRQSLEYMDALHSVYNMQETNQIYQKSLDMIVGMSFGSVSLVRTMQLKQAQRQTRLDTFQGSVHSSSHAPFPAASPDLTIFHNPRIMFLLFMRSVTINMILLWVLLTRFILAATAAIFDGLQAFSSGIAIYTSPILTSVDLGLTLIISILVGIPAFLELLELGATPVHNFDLFVLTPVAILGVIANILSLFNVGTDLQLFGILHIFILWPLLTILVLIRLLRVIGERISQAESLTHTHSSTRAVDFYWTAPTPDDDRWLVNELTRCADLPSVQLHRFLTRCSGPNQDRGSNGTKLSRKQTPSLHTHYGRPNWERILNETAERCENNSTIGVFFCGPLSMGEAVQRACMQAMRNSIVRGLQCGAQAMRGLEAVFGEAVSANEYTGEDVESGNHRNKKGYTRRGCNVKFVFKRESFA